MSLDLERSRLLLLQVVPPSRGGRGRLQARWCPTPSPVQGLLRTCCPFFLLLAVPLGWCCCFMLAHVALGVPTVADPAAQAEGCGRWRPEQERGRAALRGGLGEVTKVKGHRLLG